MNHDLRTGDIHLGRIGESGNVEQFGHHLGHHARVPVGRLGAGDDEVEALGLDRSG
jgi:hypothetical protein